jgi:hypothetical protein
VRQYEQVGLKAITGPRAVALSLACLPGRRRGHLMLSRTPVPCSFSTRRTPDVQALYGTNCELAPRIEVLVVRQP